MSTSTIPQLRQAIGLTGTEQLEAVQAGASVRITSAMLALLANSVAPIGPTGVAAASPAAGENDNYTVSGEMGPTIGFIDLTPSGNCNITGLEAGFNGQIIIITNLSAFVLILNALNSGSLAPNQFRMFGDLSLSQNNGQPFKYSTTIGKWVAI